MNLKQLAQSLQLSPTTVSRALAGYSDVSAATRQRVMDAAAAAGYHPDSTARRLATGRADAIGLVHPFGDSGLGDPRFVEVMAGMSEAFGQARMDLLIAASHPDSELETYRRLTRARTVDALVVANTQRDDARIRLLQERGFPFLAYGRTESRQPYAWFDFDNQAGGRLATERLLRLGHRRIGLIHAQRRYTFADQRLAGFHDALQAAGVAPLAELLHEVELSRDAGHTAMRRLLALAERPTAVLVDNNLSGVGALRALAEAGLHPGRDLSLIVYDGVPADLPLPYRVTCIEQPTGDLAGRTMARLVLDLLAGKPVEDLHALAQPRLAEGDTDAPA